MVADCFRGRFRGSGEHQPPKAAAGVPAGSDTLNDMETLAGIAIALLVVVVVIAAIVLSIVRFATRMERKIGRPTRGTPKTRASGRGARRTVARGGATPSRTGRAQPARPRPRAAGRVVGAVLEPRAEMRWMGAGTTLRMHELAIAGPMAYVAGDRRASGVGLDPSEIIGTLTVNPRSRAEGPGDWPSYARLTAEQRFAYLKWLSGGRAELVDDGYLMLHFFGLERRALLEGLDLAAVVQEVCRVREMVARALAGRDGDGHGGGKAAVAAGGRRLVSYMRQTGAFLWTLVARRPEAFSERDVKVLSARMGSSSEEGLVSALAWFVRSGGASGATAGATDATDGPAGVPLAGWMARIVAEHQPGAKRSVVLERVWERFAALFDARYAEGHGAGLVLRVAKRERALSYRAANQSIGAVQTRVADAMGIASQFAPLVELWNGCIEDLRGLARVGAAVGGAGAAGGAAITLAQWDAMPVDLRVGMENPFADGLAELAARHADGAGHAIVGVGDVVAAMRMADQPSWTERATYSPSQCAMLARAVDEAGMALEPDARITGAGMARDASVVLVSTAIPNERTEEAAARYLAASCVLRLGAAVALADGEADERELAPIAMELERAFELSEDEHRRLDALMALLRAKGSSVRAVGKRLLAGLSVDARRSVGRLLVAVASADGVLGEAERTALKSGYRALGLENGELEKAIEALWARAGSGADGGAAAGEIQPLVLDREAIARIMAETKEVAEILAAAMRGDADEEEREGEGEESESRDELGRAGQSAGPAATTPTAAAIGATTSSLPATGAVGLSTRYAAFYAAIVERAEWSEQEASGVARSMGMMLSGAIEAVNDWSYERAGGPVLIEEGGRILVDGDRRKGLKGGV